MEIIYSPEHRRQHGRAELTDGRLVPVYEHPGRIDAILGELARRGFATPEPPEDRGLAPVTAVHDPAYVAFLQCAWDEWVAPGNAPPRTVGPKSQTKARPKPDPNPTPLRA